MEPGMLTMHQLQVFLKKNHNMGYNVMTRNAISFHQKALKLFQKHLLHGKKCFSFLRACYHLYGMLLHESKFGQSIIKQKHSPEALYRILQKEMTLVGKSQFKQVLFQLVYSLHSSLLSRTLNITEYTDFSVLTLKNYSCPSRLIENICSSFFAKIQWAISDCAKLSLWSHGWSPACKPWGFLGGVKLLWKHLGIILFKTANFAKTQNHSSGVGAEKKGGRTDIRPMSFNTKGAHPSQPMVLMLSHKIIFPQN